MTDPLYEPSNESLRTTSEAIATLIHEDWRHTRLDDAGHFTPLFEATRDEAWISAHHAGDVDIANTSYAELPGDLKAKSKAEGEIIAHLLDSTDENFNPSNPEELTQLSSAFHQAWLARHQWAKGGKLDMPFENLPTDEQEKIRHKVSIGVRYRQSTQGA